MQIEELHIASLVVHSTPRRLDGVAAAIATAPGAVVHAASGQGKLVVTLEASTSEAITAMVAHIQHIDGVLSAAMVYQCADSLDAMNEEIPDA
jgi:periplasmic nitrate reductase NapD